MKKFLLKETGRDTSGKQWSVNLTGRTVDSAIRRKFGRSAFWFGGYVGQVFKTDGKGNYSVTGNATVEEVAS